MPRERTDRLYGPQFSFLDTREQVRVGSSLIELLLYTLLLSFLGLLLFQGGLTLQSRIRGADKKSVVRIGMYAALDVFTRDVREAPAAITAWHALESARISWRTERHEIAWYVAQGCLYRMQKNYTVRMKTREKPVVSLVAQGIALFSFQLLLQENNESQVAGVLFRVESTMHESVEGVIAVRARELP